ncbi:hypothetical protein ACFWA6_22765 [Streptomyces sp. NPDC060020]|uniref:hypothetical protein n=1 Tax=Streptomyces sp. NPDC060020 TaxID=3347038 RepID=UPI0036BE1D7F
MDKQPPGPNEPPQPDYKTVYGLTKDSIAAVITLASGILGISLTFSKNWAGDAASDSRDLLIYSWVLFLASIVCGVGSLLVVAGLARFDRDIYQKVLRIPWALQLLLFLAALVIFVIFGISVIDDLAPAPPIVVTPG